jgi:hypothetical protein
MRATFVLPTLFGLGATGLGGQLLWRAYQLEAGDPERMTVWLKGGGLCLVGLSMLGLLIWKSGIGRR